MAKTIINTCMVIMLVMIFVSIIGLFEHVNAQLSYNYYDTSCPRVETIVRATLVANLLTDPTAPAPLVRLAFHDCQVQGCDASILLDSAPASGISAETSASANLGIRRLDFIDRIKAALESACPGVVSCADVVALAARDAINISGGPRIAIPLGRRDATSASSSQAQSAIPPPTVSVDATLALFGAMGMSTAESVAMLGAHTLGVAHCSNVANRLYPGRDSALSVSFYNSLRARCPSANSSNVVNLDSTNVVFDNQYFRDLVAGRGLLTVDSEISLDSRTSPIVSQFAANRTLFFQTFSSAFVKLTSYKPLAGSQGQVRTNCHRVNAS